MHTDEYGQPLDLGCDAPEPRVRIELSASGVNAEWGQGFMEAGLRMVRAGVQYELDAVERIQKIDGHREICRQRRKERKRHRREQARQTQAMLDTRQALNEIDIAALRQRVDIAVCAERGQSPIRS